MRKIFPKNLNSAIQGRLVFGNVNGIRTAPVGPFNRKTTENVLIEFNGARLSGWVTPRSIDKSAKKRRLILWFGGRNEHIAWTQALSTWLGPSWEVVSFSIVEQAIQMETLLRWKPLLMLSIFFSGVLSNTILMEVASSLPAVASDLPSLLAL